MSHYEESQQGSSIATEKPSRLDGRRIARELRDRTSQILTNLEFQLAQLRRVDDAGAEAIVRECEEAIASIRNDIQSLDPL